MTVKINQIKAFFFISIILSGIFLYFLDLSFKVGKEFFLIGILFLYLLFILFLSVKKFNNLLNPITLLVPFLFAIIYYQFMISQRQEELSFETNLSIFLFLFFYIAGVFVKFKKYSSDKINLVTVKRNYNFVKLLFIGGIIIFLIEMFLNGGFPFLMTLFYGINIYTEMSYVPVLHYLVMLNSLFPAIFYFYYKKSVISKSQFIVFIAISSFILLNLLSRQIMILGIMTFFLVYVKVNSLNIGRLLFIFIPFVAVFFLVLGTVRFQAIDVEVDEVTFMKSYSDVPIDLDVNMFDITYNLYTSMNFNTLNEIILKSQDYMYGVNTFKSLIQLFKIDQAFGISYLDEFNTFGKLATIIGDPYLDFGYLGVAFFAFLYGVFVSFIYRKYIFSNDLGYTIAWSVVSYIMTMSVFANYFNVLFMWICLFLAFSLNYKLKVTK